MVDTVEDASYEMHLAMETTQVETEEAADGVPDDHTASRGSAAVATAPAEEQTVEQAAVWVPAQEADDNTMTRSSAVATDVKDAEDSAVEKAAADKSVQEDAAETVTSVA
jgi:hypothetical protein